METLLGSLMFGLAGAALWHYLVRPKLPTHIESYDGRGMLFVFVLALMTSTMVSAVVLKSYGVVPQHAAQAEPASGDADFDDSAAADPDADELEPAEIPFGVSIRALTLGNAAAIFLLALLAWRQPSARLPLGLNPSPARAPFLTAFAAYLMTLPLIGLLAYLSQAVLGDAVQPLLRSIGSAENELSPATWLSFCVLIPFAEELLFRGALFGGLRSRLGFWPAALGSAAVFAVLHENPVFYLPLMGLGVVLAWLRERTGSLTAPLLLHALNNANAIAMTTALE